MSTREHVVVVCDHPSLHRGFSVVGERIARHLHRDAGLRVSFLGRYEPEPAWRSPGYTVHDLHPKGRYTEAGDRDPSLAAALREHVCATAAGRVTVLCIGTFKDLLTSHNELDASGLRSRVRLIGYMPVDSGPLPVQFAAFAQGYDVVVPYSRYARAVLEDCFRRARYDPSRLHSPIAHGVDTRVFAPPAPQRRRAARRRLFGIGDDVLLVGYFGRNSGHKRPDLVLRLFQLFATGAYGVCARCGATTGDALAPDGRPGPAAARCGACDAPGPARGAARDDVLLYLHTDLQPDEARRAAPDARDLERIAARLGIASRVRFAPGIEIGRGVDVGELALRMGACDVHVLPYVCAGWELTVLETGACAVPNVITDAATPPGYAAPFSRVIPAAMNLLETDARALIDIDLALRALLELAASPAERARLGAAGVVVARGLDWERVGEQWTELLRS